MDQIVTRDMGVSLHYKIHPLFMKYSNGTSTVSCIPVSELVSCAFSTILICPFFIYLSPLFCTCFHVYYTIVSRQLETELTHDL